MGALVPTFNPENGQVSISALLNNTTRLSSLITTLVDGRATVTGSFFAPGPGTISGGGINHSVLAGDDSLFPVDGDAEVRAPGGEHRVVRGDELRRIAAVENFAAKTLITKEAELRRDTVTFANQIAVVSNAVARAVDKAALAVVDTVLDEYDVPDVPALLPWNQVETVGAEATLTPGSQRPLAQIVAARTSSAVMDSTVPELNVLLLNPADLGNLATAYAENFAAAMASANLTVRTSNFVPMGTGYLVAEGAFGFVLYEGANGISADTEYFKDTKTTAVYVDASPAFAAVRPHAVRRLTGLYGVATP